VSQRAYIGLALGLVLAGSVLLWWVLSRPTTTPPPRQSIEGLQDTVTVGWTDRHTAVLDYTRSTDALTALGYVHGMTRPWTVTVWRRTALGTLSASFGERLVPLDRHARQLGFAHHARRTYNQLPSSAQRRLRAYTRGLNAALGAERVQQRAPFVHLNLTPARWKPWHPLAIERLLAWTGTDVSSLFAADRAGPPEFRRADRRLRRWLHLHGRARSIAWAARPSADSARPALFARHVLGASAEPLVQEVLLRPPSTAPTATASLPGAPVFPTGTTGSRSWTYLLSSPARLTRVETDTTRIRTRHERITPAEGPEHLVTIRRQGERLLARTAAPDSAWALTWPGLQPHSDVPRWTAHAQLREDVSPFDSVASAFRLFGGSGLTMTPAGEWTVRGRPPVVERGPETVLIGRSPWARHQANGLRARRVEGPVRPSRWSASDSSTWAAELLPRLLPALAPLDDTAPLYEDALSYLRNWDFVYEPASIGAVVFEEWMRAYRAETGRMPTAEDSTLLAPSRHRQAFRHAVDHLETQYGSDVRQWRWERVAPDRRYFPVWSADSLVAADLSSLSTTRFAPLDRPGRGHPSALSGGPTLVDPPALGPAPTRWDGWMRGGVADLTVRRLRFDPSDFFARSFLPREPPSPASVTAAPITRTTKLVPPRP
jgi:hypothetical protein